MGWLTSGLTFQDMGFELLDREGPSSRSVAFAPIEIRAIRIPIERVLDAVVFADEVAQFS